LVHHTERKTETDGVTTQAVEKFIRNFTRFVLHQIPYIRVIRSRRIRWAGHVICIKRECTQIFVEKEMKGMDDLKELSICGRLK